MKVVFSSNTAWYLYNFRKGTIKRFIEKEYEVVIIAPTDKYSYLLKELGCKINHLYIRSNSLNPVHDSVTLVHLLSLYIKIKPDIIYNFTPKINIYSSLVSYFFPRVKVINNIAGLGTAFINEGMKKIFLTYLYKLSQKRADFVFFQNNEDHNYFVKEKIVCESKSKRILGSGVNLDFFKPTKINKEDHIKFLLVARLIEQKGIRLYAEAAKIIKEKYPHVEFSLLGPIISNNPFAIHEKEIKNWEDLGTLNYLGHSDNVAEVLIDYDCVVLPSFYREGVPKSLLEAAASGKIIITTDNIGCRDAVVDGVTGFLCKPKSLESLLEAFYKVLQLDYDSFVKMKIGARELAKAKFDENIIIEEYLKTASN